MSKKPSGKPELSAEELQRIKSRAREHKLEDSDYERIVAILETVEFLRDAVHKKTVAVKRLLGMIFGVRTEKSVNVLPGGATKPARGDGRGAFDSPLPQRTRQEWGGTL